MQRFATRVQIMMSEVLLQLISRDTERCREWVKGLSSGRPSFSVILEPNTPGLASILERRKERE